MKSNRLIVFFVFSILLSGCSQSLPKNGANTQSVPNELFTQEPEPTSLPPTQTSAPTVPPAVALTDTPEPTEEVILSDTLFRKEEFENEIDTWSWFVTSGREDKTQIYRDRGRVVFELLDEDIYAYLMYDKFEYDDVKLSTQVENRGKNTYSVSLICRYDKNTGWYEFNIGGDGLYSILRYDGTLEDGKYALLANGGSNQIRTGQNVNEYIVSCEGENLTLWINGKETQSVKDNTLKKGLVGISTSSYYVTPIVMEFEYLEISKP